MAESWHTEYPDELARCLADAQTCAAACEALLAVVATSPDDDLRRRVLDAVVAPAAVARVLGDLLGSPKTIVVAAASLCRDGAREAAVRLEALGVRVDARETVAALDACAASCDVLIAL